jgi:hypothetical protein
MVEEDRRCAWPGSTCPRSLATPRGPRSLAAHVRRGLLGGAAQAPRARPSRRLLAPSPIGIAPSPLRGARLPLRAQRPGSLPARAPRPGILQSRSLIRIFERLEALLYRTATGVVHSEGNRGARRRPRGARDDNGGHVQHVDTEQIKPGPRANALARTGMGEVLSSLPSAGSWGSRRTSTSSWTRGELAGRGDRLRPRGRGRGDGSLRDEETPSGLGHVRWLRMLPRHRYPLLLEASDVCLTTLHAR